MTLSENIPYHEIETGNKNIMQLQLIRYARVVGKVCRDIRKLVRIDKYKDQHRINDNG